MGVCSKYSKGATIVFPSICLVSGSVSDITSVFPEKPTVQMDELERGRLKPFLPFLVVVVVVKLLVTSFPPPAPLGTSTASLQLAQRTGLMDSLF